MNEQNRLRLPTAVRRALWILAALVVIGAGLFLGWYLEPAATQFVIGQGTQVTAETTFDADATVYAHWRLPGDVNGDGKVAIADVTLLAKFVKAHGEGVTIH